MYGADLEVIDASAFSQVDGPAAGNKAIQGVATVPDLKLSVQGVTAYTIVWDVKIPIPEEYDQWGSYFTGFWNGTYMTSGNSSIFFVYRHAEYDGPKLDIGGGAGLGYSKLAIYEANPPWLRVVITVDRSAGSRKTYCNGVLVVEPEGNVLNIDERLDISNAFYFARNPKNAGTDAVPHPISAIAVWSKVLTDREIAALGGL
jgi:hypothetical protein